MVEQCTRLGTRGVCREVEAEGMIIQLSRLWPFLYSLQCCSLCLKSTASRNPGMSLDWLKEIKCLISHMFLT